MKATTLKTTIRSIALTIVFSTIGFIIVFLLEKLLNIELSKIEMAVIAFIVTAFSALYLFPRVFGIPFGKVSVAEFIRKNGLGLPRRLPLFILLGILAAALSLGGMLAGSLLTGEYVFDRATINLPQALFSLTPGIWEEVFYRGILMIILLRITKSITKAAVIQILIFCLAHIKGIDLLSLIDALSVLIIAIAFTYMAIRTKSLIPGIVFHYLHDTFLFSVQLPDEAYTGFRENALFYAGLWLAILVIIGMTKLFSDYLGTKHGYELYAME